MAKEQQQEVDAESIGAAFRVARQRCGLTQEDAAERVGLATEVYGRLERGQMLPSVRTLRSGCVTLGVDPAEALGLQPGKAMEGLPVVEDSPAVRRLARKARQLPPDALDVLNRMAGVLLRRDDSEDEVAST